MALIDSSSGQTVATTVSNSQGSFALDTPAGFTPVTTRPYYVEAVKGLPVGGAANRAGASAARLRTLVFYDGSSWESLASSTPGSSIDLGWASTAVSLVCSLRNLTAIQMQALEGTVVGQSFSPPGGSAISSTEFTVVMGLVNAALAGDQDPVEAIAYDPTQTTPGAQYKRRSGTLTIDGYYSPKLATPGGTVTFYGQNFPSPGGAVSVTLGPQRVSWAVSADRTQLAVTLPSNAYSGLLQITAGSSTWTGPFVPVAGTIGALAGGGGNDAYIDGTGTMARLSVPYGLAFDSKGNLYVADCLDNVIRKITKQGVVSTFAGNGSIGHVDGPATVAEFYRPQGLAFDSGGNLYVSEAQNNDIREITPAGVVSTFAGQTAVGYADGVGTAAQFNDPDGLAFDSLGNLYVCDQLNDRIRKVSPGGVVSTLAGSGYPGYWDGPAATAQFNNPFGIAVDPSGDVYVSDADNNCIRLVTPDGYVMTIAGNPEWNYGPASAAYSDGPGASAQFHLPAGIALDSAGDLYVADANNNRIRKINLATGIVSTLAGSGTAGDANGPASTCQFNGLYYVAVDPSGDVYADDNNTVRILTPTAPLPTRTVTTQVFTYTGAPQAFTVPTGVTTILADLQGAAGGDACNEEGNNLGGRGGRMVGYLSVSGGQVLNLNVGGRGHDGVFFGGTPQEYMPIAPQDDAGGYNGGGAGGIGGNTAYQAAAGGGGATDIRVGGAALSNRVLVAGGGGGAEAAYNDAWRGGDGGGPVGTSGLSSFPLTVGWGGLGGTQLAGGPGGTDPYGYVLPGSAGSLGQGGAGATENMWPYDDSQGGGGGGGYYGGGGGGSQDNQAVNYGGCYYCEGGSGGGGSGYAGSGTSGVTMTTGYSSFNGVIVLSWVSGN